jgi:hypothetical protein
MLTAAYNNGTDNESKSAPAKILVFMVKNKGAAVSRDASPREAR